MNRLASALSPYLRQHADNPVGWWEWGAAAFEEARRRDVPLFVSIGYAACHWCHVMAHESFEDPAVAQVLDSQFVPVKVDREERPDVDAVLMDVTVALTGHGGWPMSVWLTPEGHAFHAGTYYPSTARGGMPSFLQVLAAVTQAWQDRRDQVMSGAAQITAELDARGRAPAPGTLTAADVDQAIGRLLAQADDVHGGFGDAPKFPPSTVLDALLRRAAQADGPVADHAWQQASQTLQAMARGGLYDQLEGGFARYSVDAGWVVPHFEKMLYDNALLLGGYARAAVQAQQRDEDPALYERVATETVEWLSTRMRTPAGAFAASLDADSDDGSGQLHEGAFAVWTPEQLIAALGERDGRQAAQLLTVTEAGTFEGGTSVLQLRTDPEDQGWFADVRAQLRSTRAQRAAPARDDKVVTAWNGWAIASLAEAAMLLGRPDWLAMAQTAASAVVSLHLDGDRLARVSLGGERSAAPGGADDYAALAHGLLTLAEATGDASWLDHGLRLLDLLHERFAAPDAGLFDSEAGTADAGLLVRRPRDLAENATPSGTTAALIADRIAFRLTGEDRWRERADALARGAAAYVVRAPRAAGWALADAVAELGTRRPVEIAVVGADPGALAALAWRAEPPGSVVVAGEPDGGIPLLADRPAIEGAATAYVCRGHVCELPVTSIDGMQRLLR